MPEKVKPGDIVKVRGRVYRFGPTSTECYNHLLEIFEQVSFSPEEKEAYKIHLFLEDGEGGSSLSFQDLKEALEK